MTSTAPVRIEIDGRQPTSAELGFAALVNYGHFTGFQVRAGRLRGLAPHMDRLVAATRELFGTDLDPQRVREYLRHALRETPDASVRINVFRPDEADEVQVLVALGPPASSVPGPVSLLSVPYQRPLAHVKHVGTFGQIHFGNRAEAKGFDDALLTAPDGLISETTMANIGFSDGHAVFWPQAPVLHGTTMRILDTVLPERGVPVHRRPIRLSDVAGFSAAFVANAIGVVPVDRIDDMHLNVHSGLMDTLSTTWDSVPWDAP